VAYLFFLHFFYFLNLGQEMFLNFLWEGGRKVGLETLVGCVPNFKVDLDFCILGEVGFVQVLEGV